MKLLRRLRYVWGNYGELILNLAVRNLKVQYKHALLGFLWALFVPLTMMVVFWFIFGLWMRGVRGEGIGPFFLISALFPWTFMQMSISGATSSITENRDIIRKVYFPKEIIPLSVVLSNVFHFAISMSLLLVLLVAKCAWFGEWQMISAWLLFLPVLMALTIILAAGVGLLTACGQVYFRDVRYLVEIGLLVWFYFSPVFYPISLVKGFSDIAFRLYMLNPVAALITLYRTVLRIGNPCGDLISIPWLVASSTALILVIFTVGYSLFVWREKEFVDLV